MKKKFILYFSFLFCLSLSLNAQKAERVKVTLEMQDGSEVETMMYHYPDQPWVYQKELLTFDPSLRDEKKIKGKDITKYKAKDLFGYKLEGKTFEAHKVSLVGDSDLSPAAKAVPAFAFIEVIVEGPIRVYKGYGFPPTAAKDLTTEEINTIFLETPDYFLSKKGHAKDKVRRIDGLKFRTWIEDCPEVVARFDNGEFGNAKRKEGKKLSNLIRSMGENDDPEMRLSVISAYNEAMNK